MNKGRVGELAGGAREFGKIAFGKETIADVAHIDAGARAEHAQDERFGRHFQAEYTTGNFCSMQTFSAMFMAREVLPMEGRAAMTIISPP